MSKIEIKELVKAGVHFGHLTRKWNPNMSPFIYSEKNGIHIINLYKTINKLEEACGALEKISSSGRKILFVATKKQAKDIISKSASEVNMPYITERWPGGMLTNFVTIRKAVKKMSAIDRTKEDGTFETLSKKEKLNFLDQIKISSQDNRPIVIFPQGTRTEPHERPNFKKGVARIYTELNMSCLPVTINSGEVWPKNGELSKHKNITISILEPIKPGLEGKEFLNSLQNAMYEILDKTSNPSSA